MSDLKEQINKYFKPKPKKVDFESLMHLVEQTIGELGEIQKLTAPPEQQGKLLQERDGSYDAIPEIPVSELGWSDVRTTEKGTEVSGPQRRTLESYLSNIRGTDLSEKLASLSEFYTTGLKFPANATAATKVSKILSYLTFYKTLTSVIQNFNAASAGFSFESFLGALLGGTQVPTGEGTIADLTAGDGTPISLKLYTEKSVKVDGSWTDLINDLTDGPGYMQYVVCMKSLQGKGLEQEGTIKFYRFNFTLDNVLDINAHSRSHSRSAMQLPVEFLESMTDVSAGLPSRETVSPEELEKAFVAYIEQFVDDPEKAETLVDTLDWANRDDLFNTDKTRGKGSLSKSAVKLAVDKTIEVGIFAPEQRADLIDRIIAANNAAIEYVKGSSERRVAALGEMAFASSEDSAEAYATLSEDQKKLALKNTRGYLYTDQFSLNRQDVLDVASYSTAGTFPQGQGDVFLGEIKIGSSYVVEMLNRAKEIMDASVFEIVSNVKILTTNINSYFAGGLRNDNKAQAAITAADTIEGKTEELRRPDEKQ